MNTILKAACALTLAFAFAGCGTSTMSTSDVMAKTENAKTVDDVKSALGGPSKYEASDVPVIGKLETLTYTARDGEVVITAHNGKIFSRFAGETSKKDK